MKQLTFAAILIIFCTSMMMPDVKKSKYDWESLETNEHFDSVKHVNDSITEHYIKDVRKMNVDL